MSVTGTSYYKSDANEKRTTASFFLVVAMLVEVVYVPKKSPQSGHSSGPVAKVVRHAGQVISSASKSRTMSADFCSSSVSWERQLASNTAAAWGTSSLATASDNVVPHELVLQSGLMI